MGIVEQIAHQLLQHGRLTDHHEGGLQTTLQRLPAQGQGIAVKGQLLAQERAPGSLDGRVLLFLAKPEVIDDAVAGQRRTYIATSVLTTLLVLLIAVTAALAVSRQPSPNLPFT